MSKDFQVKHIAAKINSKWKKAFSEPKQPDIIQDAWPWPKSKPTKPLIEVWPFPEDFFIPENCKWPFPSDDSITQEKDPNGKSPNSPGAKVDAGKDRVWLCLAGFSRALEQVAKVTTIGASKYTPNGWVDVPNAEERYMDAFARHLLAVGRGEVYDNGKGGTGTKHMAQCIWNLLAVLELQERNENRTSIN